MLLVVCSYEKIGHTTSSPSKVGRPRNTEGAEVSVSAPCQQLIATVDVRAARRGRELSAVMHRRSASSLWIWLRPGSSLSNTPSTHECRYSSTPFEAYASSS